MKIKFYRERSPAIQAIRYDGSEACFEKIKAWVEKTDKNLRLNRTPYHIEFTEINGDVLKSGKQGDYVGYDNRVFSLWPANDFETAYEEG